MITLKLFDHIFYQNNRYATVYQQFCSKQGSALWQLDYNIVCTYNAYFLGTLLQLLINADIHPSIHPFSSAYLIQSHSSNFMHEVQTRFRLGKQNDLVKEGHVWVFWELVIYFGIFPLNQGLIWKRENFKEIVIQITSCYNQDMKMSIFECTGFFHSTWMSFIVTLI